MKRMSSDVFVQRMLDVLMECVLILVAAGADLLSQTATQEEIDTLVHAFEEGKISRLANPLFINFGYRHL